MDLEQDDINLVNDGASDAPEPAEPEHVGDAVREAYTRAQEQAEAGDDPEKLEAIRVRRAKDGRFDRREPDGTQKPAKDAQSPSEGLEKPAAEKPASPSEKISGGRNLITLWPGPSVPARIPTSRS